ncbi:hypothetical protein CXR25_13715 [Brevibacterium aurantiacum]|uniref:hypothetical protein n=1 Tax=Brevibacterium aurantiacum TaxID=273384 RepID=UPI000F650CF0|nr:hypothetical protein [Brevibacterium aurantiacum]AZL13754.1 hypothetical protein CXR25_13715 [Brevibacterium aurantiacum]
MSNDQPRSFAHAPSDWYDVDFAIASGRRQGYVEGHEDGHRMGWDAALARAKTNEAAFIRGIVDDYRRRELEDEHMDTSDYRAWIKQLIESVDAKARRDEWDARVRAERVNNQSRSNAA